MWIRLFRYPVDVWPTLLVLGVFAVQVATFALAKSPWVMAFLGIALLPFCASITAYNHNHIHVPTFVPRAPNRVMEVIMFFQIGSSPLSGTLNHIMGHHATYFEPARDTLSSRRRDHTIMTRNEFALKKALWHYPSCFVFGREQRGLFAQFLGYLVVGLVLLGWLVAIKPVAALLVFVLPMAATLYVLKWGAYAHHTGLPLGDDYTASRTNTRRLYNRLTWNSGYHAAHHFKQALHWSKLPEYHSELAARIPPELQGPGWGEAAPRSSITTLAVR